MKIAIDISQTVYQGTGVANYTYELAKSILKNDKRNDYLLFGSSLRQKKKLSNIARKLTSYSDKAVFKVLPIPQTIGEILWNRLHILNIEKLIGKIDILHTSDWIEPPSKAFKVTTIHDLVVYKHPELSNTKIVNNQKKKLSWVKKETDVVIADSYATRQDIIDILRIDIKKIRVVYPGVSSIFQPQKEEKVFKIRKKYGLSKDYLLTIGTHEPRKNFQKTLKAFQKFRSHFLVSSKKNEIELVLAGRKGWGGKLVIPENVRYLGFIKKEDLPSLYSGAIMFVYPSLYEGFGLPVVEAMACGCPVISSLSGSLSEIIEGCALIVDPENEKEIAISMSKLFIDRKLRDELSEKGIKNSKRFTWEKAAVDVISVYESFN